MSKICRLIGLKLDKISSCSWPFTLPNLLLSAVVRTHRFIWLPKLVDFRFLSVFCEFMFFVRDVRAPRIPNWVSWLCSGCLRYPPPPPWSFVPRVTDGRMSVLWMFEGRSSKFQCCQTNTTVHVKSSAPSSLHVGCERLKNVWQKQKPKLWTFIWCFGWSCGSCAISLSDFVSSVLKYFEGRFHGVQIMISKFYNMWYMCLEEISKCNPHNTFWCFVNYCQGCAVVVEGVAGIHGCWGSFQKLWWKTLMT